MTEASLAAETIASASGTARPHPAVGTTFADGILLLLAATVVQRLVGFVREIFVCRWLDHQQLGQWNVTFAFFVLAAPLAVMALPGVFQRYVQYYLARGKLRTLVRRSALFCAALSLAAVTAVCCCRGWFSHQLYQNGDQGGLVVLIAVGLLGVIPFNYLVELFTGLKDVRTLASLQLLNSLLFAGLSIGLLAGGRGTVADLVIAYCGACLISATAALWHLRHTLDNSPDSSLPLAQSVFWGKLLPFAGWLWFNSLLVNCFDCVDRYMLLHWSGLSAAEAAVQLAHYHSSRVLPLLLVSIATLVSTQITPFLSHDWEEGRHELVARRLNLILKLSGFGLAIAAVVVLWTAPLLFSTALRNKFPEGLAVLPLVLTYCTWISLRFMTQNYLWCAEKAAWANLATLAGLLVAIGLNLVLLPRLGLRGAIISTGLANLLSLALVCAFSRRLGLRIDRGTIVVFALPLLFLLGPWATAAVLVLLPIAAWRDERLFCAAEKYQLVEGIRRYRELLLRLWNSAPLLFRGDARVD